MAKITYTNKVALNELPSIADINKVKAGDMNEIKSVVNENADIVMVDETATSGTKLLIEDEDLDFQGGTEITNSYSASTTLGYSCNYLNGEDFSGQVNFNETGRAYCQFTKVGNMVNIIYSGQSKTRAEGDTILTLPEGYRPSTDILVGGQIGYTSMALITIASTGVVSVSKIQTSVQNRLYFNISYYVG